MGLDVDHCFLRYIIVNGQPQPCRQYFTVNYNTSTSLQSITKFFSERFPGYTLVEVHMNANYGKGRTHIVLNDANIDIIRQRLNYSNRNNTVGLLNAYMVNKLKKNKGNPNELKPVIKFFYLSKKAYVAPKKKSSKVRSNSWLLPELDLATSNKRLLKPSVSKPASSKLQRSNSLPLPVDPVKMDAYL